MLKDWSAKKLGQVCKIFSGFGFPKALQGKQNGDYPFGKVGNISNIVRSGKHLIGDAPNYIDMPDVKKLRAKPFPAGTVVFAKIGEAIRQNFRALTTREMLFDNNVCGVKPNTNIIDPMFLLHFLNTIDLYPFTKTTAVPSINKSVLESIEISYPSLDKQRCIVARIKECMDPVDEIERLRAEALQERDYLLESLIEAEYQEVDGDDVTLADVCSITSRLVDPREHQFLNLLHVGGGNIEAKTGKLLKLKTAREEELKSGKFTFDESMVLYNKIRPYLMKVSRPDFSGLCSADMYPLSPNPKKLTRDFLFYLLLSQHFTDYAIAGSNRAGMPKVNRNYLFSYQFTLPPIEKQKQITERLDAAASAVEGLRGNMAESASEAKAIRESILRKAFAGEL